MGSDAPDAFHVDTGELEAVIGDLATCHQRLQAATDDLEQQVARLHDHWTGLTATAQREAHEEWSAGMADMQEALEAMRAAARVAHTNYTQAVRGNVAMWQGLD
ncbi:WXG100 family type VII secretion target [Nocardioides flavescens]|uniref:ESAT-6-like protein n=1 Tax=Nocardioides flavescens TaxID=2691959 RepID=A0A6L7F3Y3_9ACTN|nr:WXG100 family type VII secretion target [Nocardioides flavescens]MXG91953.1 WXG100 family type VII secretion target [Nocardioides flavescens]